MRFYVKPEDGMRWCVLESVTLGASVVTACSGRWPQTEPMRISDRPEPGKACGGCELVIARGGPAHKEEP